MVLADLPAEVQYPTQRQPEQQQLALQKAMALQGMLQVV